MQFCLLFVYLCFHVQRDGSSPVDCWWATLSGRKNAWRESVFRRRAPFRHQGFSQQVSTTSCLLHCCILTLGFCFPAPHDVELWARCSFCPLFFLMSLSRVTRLHPPLSRTLEERNNPWFSQHYYYNLHFDHVFDWLNSILWIYDCVCGALF